MNYARSITARTLITMGAIALLSACASNSVKDTLGLDRAPPDEFRVVSRPPLSVPPQFNLRPPSTANDAPSQPSASSQAQSLITGKQNASGKAGDTFSLKPDAPAPTPVAKPAMAVGGTPAESAFLQNAGAAKADPNVRTSLQAHQEEVQQTQEECSWWEIGCSLPDKKEPLVDSKKEAERIRTDKDSGKPVTTGDTPEVKAKDTGLLGDIFGY